MVQFLREEAFDKQQQIHDFSTWTLDFESDPYPQQNVDDCGVFTLLYATCLVYQLPFQFSQDVIPALRRKITREPFFRTPVSFSHNFISEVQ
jgi:Ulp1 family protease